MCFGYFCKCPTGLVQKNVAIFSCYKEANIASRFALPLSGYSILALQQFLKDTNLFTDPSRAPSPVFADLAKKMRCWAQEWEPTAGRA